MKAPGEICAVVLAIGDELTLGQTVDTNSAWLSTRLSDYGVRTLAHHTAPDEADAIAAALDWAVVRADLVLVTGGLGPTADDVTRNALAHLLDAPLEEDPLSLRQIEEFFRRAERPMPPINRVQALRPRGATALDNPIGTAPGIRFTCGRAEIFAFPGVPAEMRAMFDRHVTPWLVRRGGPAIRTAVLHTFGWGEAAVGEALRDLMERGRNPSVGTTVSLGVVSVRLRSTGMGSEADATLAATVAEIRRRLGTIVFGTGEETLASVVVKRLRDSRQTVTTAESCTGGWVARLLTDVPGASAVFSGGWVAYANAFKLRELGVASELLDAHGAVSEAVACAMAQRAREKAGADWGLALTGIAGPEGGSPEKPVGTVWIAVAGPDRPEGRAERFCFPGHREIIRGRAANTALNRLRLALQM